VIRLNSTSPVCAAATLRRNRAPHASPNLYQFVDYRVPVHGRGTAHQDTVKARRHSRLQSDCASQTEPSLALSLLVDYVANSTLNQAGTLDPHSHAMHAVLAFARSTASGPQQALSGPPGVADRAQELSALDNTASMHVSAEEVMDKGSSAKGHNTCAPEDAPCDLHQPLQDGTNDQRCQHTALIPAGRRCVERTGPPDSPVQRSSLSHLYTEYSQVLRLSWCAEVWQIFRLAVFCASSHACSDCRVLTLSSTVRSLQQG
jgi:hypothetical protein